MAAVLCIDFDSAVLEQDILPGIAHEFAGTSVRELEEELEAGELSREQFSAEVIDRIQAGEQELVDYALSIATVRPGLLELLDWTHWNDWEPVVLATGWDLYVNPILERAGADRVVRHCGRARFTYRWRARYLSPRGIEVVDGFKLAYAATYRDQGDFVVYIGGSAGDEDAARVAHAIFARDGLLEAIQGAHDRVFAFETFDDVRTILERDAGTWLESFSSTTAAED
jgi:2-hydroxy-3-keto-5-methylthiopentenyl-1-phosphate phosphatase